MKLKQEVFEFTGIYRGEVVDNNDPLKLGRVKVRVFPFFRGASVNAIPWAVPAFPLIRGAGNYGSFVVPKVGSKVWVFFENQDYNMPVYFAEAYDGSTVKSEFNADYPDRFGFKLGNGICVYFVDKEDKKEVGIEHPSGSYIKILDDGSIFIHSASEVRIEGALVNINP